MIERNWQELQKPERIAVTASEYNERQAVISLGPLSADLVRLWAMHFAVFFCPRCKVRR